MKLIEIGISGFILIPITALISWYTTKRFYQKQIGANIYLGPLLNDVYNPLISEYKRVCSENINGNSTVLNTILLRDTLRYNSIIIETAPNKIKTQLKYIENLCLSNTNLENYDDKSIRIINELDKLQKELTSIYKEFKYK